jgi:predicted cupin superfamily sugar epimerase
MVKAKTWIKKLNLQPHPEGGYFNEVYRAEEVFKFNSKNSIYKSGRNYSTSIYYLLEGNNFSAFHKLASDETWHFYSGCPVQLHLINESGDYTNVLVGNNIEENNFPQFTVK